MAWTIDTEPAAGACVDALLDAGRALGGRRADLEAIAGLAPLLRGLAQDRKLVLRAINGDLGNVLAGKGTLFYSQQSLVLRQADRGLAIRANIWPVVRSAPRSKPITEKVLAYTVPHDHNFSFLTVGYLGPGYDTSIYEYDFAKVRGAVGERVDLRFLERTCLTPGKVMLFRSGRDVHVQYAPRSLSISLNLLVYSEDDARREQFAFDLERAAISGLLAQSGVTTIVDLLELVRATGGDGRTCELAQALARRHGNRNVRLAAARTAGALDPPTAPALWAQLAGDREDLVAQAARDALAAIDGRGAGAGEASMT